MSRVASGCRQMFMLYLRMMACWLPQTRHRRPPLPNFFGWLLMRALAPSYRQHTRNGSKTKGGGETPGERRHFVRAGVCVFACGDGPNAASAAPDARGSPARVWAPLRGESWRAFGCSRSGP